MSGSPDETVGFKPVGIKRNLLSFRSLIGFVVAGIVIYIFLRNFDFSAALTSIASANWALIFLAALAFYISLPLRGARWGLLLESSGPRMPRAALSHYYFLSWFANAILPARIGDVYRAYLLKKNRSVPISLSLGNLLSERVLDLVVTALLVAISGSFFWAVLKGTRESSYLKWGIGLTIIIVVVFVIVLVMLPFIERIAPQSVRPKLKTFRAGIFKRPSLLPILSLMTAAIWLCEALRLYLVFLALGIKAGFLAAVFISQAALILMSIPLLPAGLGLVELLMLKLLSSTGVTTAVAGAATMADRLISYWSLVALGGIVYMLSPRVR
jgi:uncharacterized protein (TIRG00374 family)